VINATFAVFYKYVKRSKRNRKHIPAITDFNGRLITESTEKANYLHSYYASVFSCEQNRLPIQSAHSDEPYIISISIIRKRLAAIRRNKPTGPDGIPWEILKLGGVAIILYLA
jgi:hypothetical protein